MRSSNLQNASDALFQLRQLGLEDGQRVERSRILSVAWFDNDFKLGNKSTKKVVKN